VDWFSGGLRFGCTRCGNCCTGEPGTVLVEEPEIRALREHLGLDDEAFRTIHTRTLPSGAVVLRERANHDCTFWDAALGCRVYAHRPRQCRTWPFWRRNVATPESWAEAARGCPGMDSGALHDEASILRSAAADGTLSSRADGPQSSR